MIKGSGSCFPSVPQDLTIYDVTEDVTSSSIENTWVTDHAHHLTSFLYSLSILKDKVHQVQSLASMFISPNHSQSPESTATAIANIGTLIQEIIVTSSSMMFSSQQMALGNTSGNRVKHFGEEIGPGFYSNESFDWYADCNASDNNNNNTSENGKRGLLAQKDAKNGGLEKISPKDSDIVELDAADLLAKYTHYCQVCGKGFKRDANLRMHMRAHGDEYKSSSALINPLKNDNLDGANGKQEGSQKLPSKYSCPHEGCRWNKKHAKFQPLKSVICVKNHYKRSHCPKMYVCKLCNRKKFSVLSDLRTHEKHCGDLKWQCSCGTTFSRKDKLMGHVALFVGHNPALNSLAKMGKADQTALQMQLDGR